MVHRAELALTEVLDGLELKVLEDQQVRQLTTVAAVNLCRLVVTSICLSAALSMACHVCATLDSETVDIN